MGETSLVVAQAQKYNFLFSKTFIKIEHFAKYVHQVFFEKSFVYQLD